MRFRASGRVEPLVVGLNRIGLSIAESPVCVAVNERKRCIRRITQVLQCKSVDVCRRAFTFVYPSRGGVSKFFRCEAPFLLRHEIEVRIMPSPLVLKRWTPRRQTASPPAVPPHV